MAMPTVACAIQHDQGTQANLSQSHEHIARFGSRPAPYIRDVPRTLRRHARRCQQQVNAGLLGHHEDAAMMGDQESVQPTVDTNHG